MIRRLGRGTRDEQMGWAVLLVMAGLVVELVSLLWNHHLAFLLFLIVGTALIVAGAALFLWATFAHAAPEERVDTPQPSQAL